MVPYKSGFAMPADETASLLPLLEQVSEMVAKDLPLVCNMNLYLEKIMSVKAWNDEEEAKLIKMYGRKY